MLIKSFLRSVCVILSICLFACLFCGCDEGDIYGAASDYIKVSHDDTDSAKTLEIGAVTENDSSNPDSSDETSQSLISDSSDNEAPSGGASSDSISSNSDSSSTSDSSFDLPELEGDQSPPIVF